MINVAINREREAKNEDQCLKSAAFLELSWPCITMTTRRRTSTCVTVGKGLSSILRRLICVKGNFHGERLPWSKNGQLSINLSLLLIGT
jgi:hypothetical protein